MLVKVRFRETQKYVKVAETEDGYDDFNTFLQKVIQKLDLPLETELHLTDESGTEVDADLFEELLQAGNLTVRVSTEKSTVVIQEDLSNTLTTSAKNVDTQDEVGEPSTSQAMRTDSPTTTQLSVDYNLVLNVWFCCSTVASIWRC
ncbi:uncharacterized protein LOC111571121 isoform X3 [Xyrichtys novacula]|uniref:Uncharacterized protein LOC111571121 isoform X3 n=1 Tax=Xyrichtys novacula TaxID=13765 RepID=A0AAV1EIQ6_XYRNO|nr:uncharacterized protein LOC111571121 isoform X3 [Xyrichtys novacula]